MQPCTGPSPGKTLRWVSPVACPRLEVGGSPGITVLLVLLPPLTSDHLTFTTCFQRPARGPCPAWLLGDLASVGFRLLVSGGCHCVVPALWTPSSGGAPASHLSGSGSPSLRPRTQSQSGPSHGFPHGENHLRSLPGSSWFWRFYTLAPTFLLNRVARACVRAGHKRPSRGQASPGTKLPLRACEQPASCLSASASHTIGRVGRRVLPKVRPRRSGHLASLGHLG